jgi:NADPH:quinone reductase-like Zn-dependent oxidoreductase
VEATAKGGLLVLYGAFSHEPTVVPPFAMLARNLTIRGLNFTTYSADDVHLAALKQFVTDGLADGSLSPVIARTFGFDDIVDAHRFIEAGRQIGKIVVTV